MIEQISQAEVGKDLVILHHYRTEEIPDPDGRYVFTVEGPKAGGMGMVGSSAQFVRIRTTGIGVSIKDSAEPDALDSVVDIQVWADAHCSGQYYPPESKVTLNGAQYMYGLAWEKHPGYDNWHITHGGMARVNGKMTDAGHDRLRAILEAVRDLYLAVPGIDKAVIRRALTVEAQSSLKVMEDAKNRIERISHKLDALDENGERG